MHTIFKVFLSAFRDTNNYSYLACSAGRFYPACLKRRAPSWTNWDIEMLIGIAVFYISHWRHISQGWNGLFRKGIGPTTQILTRCQVLAITCDPDLFPLHISGSYTMQNRYRRISTSSIEHLQRSFQVNENGDHRVKRFFVKIYILCWTMVVNVSDQIKMYRLPY